MLFFAELLDCFDKLSDGIPFERISRQGAQLFKPLLPFCGSSLLAERFLSMCWERRVACKATEHECHLTHKSATWAKICVTRAKWRRYASNANSMCLRRSSAPSAPSLVLSSPTLPTLRHDLIDRRGEVVERASDSVQLLISLASCVLITTFLQLRQ